MRVAMALDNTGSMGQDGKIAALRTAASNLVDQLSALAKNPGDVYISIVPFEGRQRRFHQLQSELDRLDRLGRRQRNRRLHQPQQPWRLHRHRLDAGEPQYMDRLRDRPDPAL
jgi:hypothetical protein